MENLALVAEPAQTASRHVCKTAVWARHAGGLPLHILVLANTTESATSHAAAGGIRARGAAEAVGWQQGRPGSTWLSLVFAWLRLPAQAGWFGPLEQGGAGRGGAGRGCQAGKQAGIVPRHPGRRAHFGCTPKARMPGQFRAQTGPLTRRCRSFDLPAQSCQSRKGQGRQNRLRRRSRAGTWRRACWRLG
jgi:hypothetical protein